MEQVVISEVADAIELLGVSLFFGGVIGFIPFAIGRAISYAIHLMKGA